MTAGTSPEPAAREELGPRPDGRPDDTRPDDAPGGVVEERGATLRVVLHLDRLEDLFEVPTTTPWDDDYRPWMRTSAADFVIGAMYSHPRCRDLDVTFVVPPEQWDEDLTTRTNRAVHRAAEAWQVESRSATRRTEFVALRILLFSVVVLFATLTINVVLTDSPSTFVRVLGDTIGVLGWLAIWYPLDALIFERLDRKVDRRARRPHDPPALSLVPGTPIRPEMRSTSIRTPSASQRGSGGPLSAGRGACDGPA